MFFKSLTRLSLGMLAASIVACGGGGHEEAAPAPSTGAAAPTDSAPAAAAAPAGGGDYMAGEVTGGGSISGTISFSGTPPEADVIEIAKDPNVCGDEKEILNVKVGPGGELADAVIWIADISSGKASAGAAGAINQKECEYTPHVQAMEAGQKLQISNSDAVLHNIHAYSADGATLFNIAQPNGAPMIPKKLKKAGPIKLKCDVHSWMNAWVFVSPHPYYAATGQDGSFSIGDVPAGSYTVKVWHEELGEQELSVAVEADGTATLDHAFAG